MPLGKDKAMKRAKMKQLKLAILMLDLRPANKQTKSSTGLFVMNQGSIVADLYRWRCRREDLSVICDR